MTTGPRGSNPGTADKDGDDGDAKPSRQQMPRRAGCWSCSLSAALPTLGCYNPPVDVSQTPAPFRFRLKKGEELSGKWEDEVTGGQLFSMYCGYCHNARAIGERPFSNYQNVTRSHAGPGPDDRRGAGQDRGLLPPRGTMFRRRARRSRPSPKRQIFSQPIPELREESAGGRQGRGEGQGRSGKAEREPRPAHAGASAEQLSGPMPTR